MQSRHTMPGISAVLGMIFLAVTLVAGSPAHAATDTTGTVTNNNGRPLADVPVEVSAVEGNFKATVTSDDEGNFQLSVPLDGDYLFRIDPGDAPEGATVPENLTEGVVRTVESDSKPIRLTLQRQASLSGNMYDEEGENRDPVEGVTVVVTGPNGFADETESDAEGNWIVYVPEPGQYNVSVDEDSLPEGVGTRDNTNYSLDRDVARGANASVLFPFGQSSRDISSTTDRVANKLVEGVRFGLLLGLAALGLSLIFGTTGLVNFAHGEMLTLGAILGWALNNGAGLHLLLAGPLAVIMVGLAGGVQEAAMWRPLRKRKTGLIAMMIMTIGLSLAARFTYLLFIGGDNKTYRQYTIQDSLDLGPVSLAPRDLVSMFIALAMLVGAGLMIRYTRFGKAMRAVSDNPSLAASSGIDVNRVILQVWVLGGVMAGLAGVLFGVSQQVKFDMGFDILLLVFAAVILGGLGTSFGAFVGSMVVGLLVTISTLWIPPELRYIPALLALILILLVRPQGILGRAERVG